MTDTHTHLYMPDSFGAEAAEVVRRSISTGVDRLVFPAVDIHTFPDLIRIADLFPENVKITFGIHPTELTETWKDDLDRMKEMMGDRKPVAVGEIGMDLHWDPSTEKLQREAFKEQVLIALRLGLPVIIHSRDALEQTIEVIESVKATVGNSLPPLIFHSFTGSPADVSRIRSVCDPFFGINGVVTFKNARELHEAIPEIGLSRIILETDSPYLAPVPHRGKRNESSYLIHIRDKVASLLGVTPQEVEKETDRNAALLFSAG